MSYTPSGLSNGTKYYWKVVATDPTGNSTSSVMNFTAIVPPVPPVSLEWSYDTGGDVYDIVISADGEYIVSSSYDDKINLFGKDNSTPLWSYDVGDYNIPVSISADGEYIVTGSSDSKVHLFDKDSSTPLWSYSTNEDITAVDISSDVFYSFY